MRTAYTGYLPVKGIRLPMGYNTTMDFRNVTATKIYVDKYAVDELIDDLAAPADVRAAPAPAPPATPVPQVTPVAKGVWLLHSPGGGGGANSILFEFADHLTMFEAPSSQAWTKALMERARATVPGKPLTELIISHHHFDHTGGIRQAMAEGLTLIAQKEPKGCSAKSPPAKGLSAQMLSVRIQNLSSSKPWMNNWSSKIAPWRCMSIMPFRKATWPKACLLMFRATNCWCKATFSMLVGNSISGRTPISTTSGIGIFKWTRMYPFTDEYCH